MTVRLDLYDERTRRCREGRVRVAGRAPARPPPSALARAEQLVESIAAHALSPRILELRGRLATVLGDAPVARRTLREALGLYRTVGATGHTERLSGELGT